MIGWRSSVQREFVSGAGSNILRYIKPATRILEGPI